MYACEELLWHACTWLLAVLSIVHKILQLLWSVMN